MTLIGNLCVQPYKNLLNCLKKQGYNVHCVVGWNYDYEKYIQNNYVKNNKCVFFLGGDYEFSLDIIKDKQDAIFFRQSLNNSLKKINEFLLPSSYGCMAGDMNLEICEITDKPKISFCGSFISHKSRPKLLKLLQENNNLICDFILNDSNCCGNIDKDIDSKIKLFNKNLKNSEFTFCPRGNGNFSIRFYEALASGRIPIIIKTDNELPFEKYIDWKEICVLVENEESLQQDIINFHKNRDLIEIQKKCKEIFKEYFLEKFDILLMNEILIYEQQNNENIISIPKVFEDMGETFDIKSRCYENFHQPYIYNLDTSKKFWFSRGGGQESVLAYDVHMLGQENLAQCVLHGHNKFFIEGCGIYFENRESYLQYSKRFIEALKKIDLYGAYLKNNHPHQELLTDYLSNNNVNVTLDIHFLFSYFYYSEKYISILRSIFRNKKILVISSHKKSIEHQIPIIDKIHNIFENCSFQVIRPPQTSCGNHGNIDWSIHLDKFLRELDNVNDFDIAILSAGGYSILISEYIYEKLNKSVIYIGGTIQLLFGIIGNRWRSGYCFQNINYFINSLDEDKPENWQLVDGNGAYW